MRGDGGKRLLERPVRDENRARRGGARRGEEDAEAGEFGGTLRFGERGVVEVGEGVHEDTVKAFGENVVADEFDEQVAEAGDGKARGAVTAPGAPGFSIHADVPLLGDAPLVVGPVCDLEAAEVAEDAAAFRVETRETLLRAHAEETGVDNHEVVGRQRVEDHVVDVAVVERVGADAREAVGRGVSRRCGDGASSENENGGGEGE